MKRLSSILLTLSLIAALFIVPARAAEGYAPPESGTVKYSFNIDWKFSKPYAASWPLSDAMSSTVDKAGHKFYDPDFDDSAWKAVSLPHTFNDEDSFRNIAEDAGDAGVYRGITFYRKEFSLPAAGKRVFLEFESARQAVYVYLNGTLAGYYEAGVDPFGIDLTENIYFGGRNVIAIAVDNTSSRGMTELIAETRPGSKPGTNDGVTFQWNTKDFNPVMGGLTGNAILYVKNSVYETLPLYSNLRTKGSYIYADSFNIPSKTADIHIETEVRNESGAARTLSLEAVICDNNGNAVLTLSSEPVTAQSTVTARKKTIVPDDAYSEAPAETVTESENVVTLSASGTASNLRFWSPDDPYLYKVYTIIKADGEAVDVTEHTTGFRKAEAKGGKNGGVFINDKHYWLTGYAQRSTNEWAAIGIANDWLHDYDAQLVRESNANFIRWMHVAAKPVDIRACDKYGIVCVQPAGDKEGDVTGRQWDQRVEAMRDTIIYFRNNPSILFYESGNSANSTEHMAEMTSLRKTLDPNGQRAMGSRSIVEPETVAESEYVGTMLGRNVWNGKEFTENGIKARDARAIVETEYHREEGPRRVWDDFSPPDFDYVNVFSGGSKISHKDAYDLTAEDFVRSDAREYNDYYSHRMQANNTEPYYSAAAALCWSDSDQHGRQQATENARMSGRVDPVRIRKQSFYAYQVMQSEEPGVYLLGHWSYPTDPEEYVYGVKDESNSYTGETALRDPKNKTVYAIAANCAYVKLFINGSEACECHEPEHGFLYAFPGIDITKRGYIEAVAYDGGGTELARHRIDTVGEPARVVLTPVTGPEGLYADGEDIAYIDVEVVDENGQVCPLDYERIDFEVTGPAVMLGGYNSGVKDLGHSNNYVYSECGVNRIFLRATREAGEITVTAKRAGLQNVTVKLSSIPFSTDENGLTVKMPQTRQQGLQPEPPKADAAYPPMQRLSKLFTVIPGTNTETRIAEKRDTAITIAVNGETVEADAYRMVGVYGEILPVLDALGISYSYDDHAGTLTAEYNGVTIETAVRSSEMKINDEPSIVNDWPEVIDGRLYAEISMIAPNLGLKTTEAEGRYEIWK